MEAKMLGKSEALGKKRLIVVPILIGITIAILVYLYGSFVYRTQYIEAYNQYVQGYTVSSFSSSTANALASAYVRNHNPYEEKSVLTFLFSKECRIELLSVLSICTIITIAFVALGIVLYLRNKKISMTVTNKRIFGIVAFNKRVDIPLDAIQSVKTNRRSGLIIQTSSLSNPRFTRLKNRDELYELISKILVIKQEKKAKREAEANQASVSGADELKKIKDLLDNGVITQEEYDLKKKQLLGL